MAKEEKKGREAVKARTDWKPAFVPALALIAVGIVPGMLKGFYEPYVSNLMAAYVTFGLLFISVVLAGLTAMVFRDLSDRKTTIFRLVPSKQPARDDEELVRITAREDQTE